MTLLKSRNVHIFLIIAAVSLAVFVGVSIVKAAAPAGYPVSSLDNCQNKEECRQVCLDSLGEHPTLCLYYFFEVDVELLQEAKDILNEGAEVFAREGGPGGCGTEEECSEYCQIPGHPGEGVIQECRDHYMGRLWWYTNMNIMDTTPLWNKIISAIITAMDKNIEPPAECRNDYYSDHLSCITHCSDSTDDYGNALERSEDCKDYLSKTGYFSKDDFRIESKLIELAKRGEVGGCIDEYEDTPPEYTLRGCFDVDGFGGLCAGSQDPVACFALADKYGLASQKDIDLGKKVAPFLKSRQTPGKCGNLRECRNYCSIQANYNECTEFADKSDLKVEVPDDKKAVFAAMQKGESPGQCKDEASCRNYCDDIDHIEECVNFVEKFKLASGDELKEIRQMADIKKSGVAFPGNCKTKESCLKYCDNSANAVACMEFALKAGFIPKEDAEAVGKILPYLKSGGKLPGGCTTKESCDTYCASESHFNECAEFAINAGFMTKEEGEILKKTGGKGPGNCRSKEACENYCKDAAHIDECVDFAVKAGFISKEEAEMAKKFKITSGPGGCKNKADCEAFCVVNQDTCFEWAKEHGMLSEQDLKNIEEQKKFLGSLDQAPPEWLACMEKELGSEFFGRFKAGKITQTEAKSPALEAAQRKCESIMGQDIRKEIEVCLSKATCAEFNSCFDALPKGNQQPSGQGQQPPQDANGKKIEARAKACIQEKMDACLGLSCSEFDACLKSVQSEGQGEGGQQGTGDQGQQQGQGTPNPKVEAKAKACQQEKVSACLSKPCSEFQACINSLGGGGEQKEGEGGGTPDPAVQSKFQTCFSPPPSGDGGGQQQQQGGDQSQIPQGFSSWEAFCRANSGDSRCAAYAPQIQQQYPLLREHSFLGAISRFLLR